MIQAASEYATEYNSNEDSLQLIGQRHREHQQIIKKFNEVKRQCIREIGFGWTLEVPL